MPRNEIDLDRVKFAAEQAQIASFIESSSDSYNSFVGERGIRLSGGQRHGLASLGHSTNRHGFLFLTRRQVRLIPVQNSSNGCSRCIESRADCNDCSSSEHCSGM